MLGRHPGGSGSSAGPVDLAVGQPVPAAETISGYCRPAWSAETDGVRATAAGESERKMTEQLNLFAHEDEANELHTHDALSALDDLFHATQRYSTSNKYMELLQFIKRFPRYSPFNCFLLHAQKPSVSFVATPSQWKKRFRRTIKANARPLVILAPMSPVLFVIDTEDTEGEPLPATLTDPFATEGVLHEGVWEKTQSNLQRDRVLLIEEEMDRSKAGWVMRALANDFLLVSGVKTKANYRIQINKVLDVGGRYATLVHELGHLYAGHLGTPNPKWWEDRSGQALEQREFEAESICYLVSGRAGIQTPSDAYLAGYLDKNRTIPQISLDCVLKVAGQIEAMGKRQLPPRKVDTKQPHQ